MLDSDRPRLTYCGNVHAAESLEAWLAVTAAHAPEVARGQPEPFGLGVWWSAPVAAELAADPGARERVRAMLDAHGLAIWTLNVFPYGGFHDARVKEAVYRPAWDHPDRRRYTLAAALAVAALEPPGSVVPLSTLPLGQGSGDVEAMASALAAVAVELATIEERTGVACVLALEPEPFCLLETVGETAAFLERQVLAAAARRAPEAVLRRHLGICVDLCHAFVVREDPLAALADCARRGLTVAKIQLSSALELRDPGELERLLAFDEERYLHQTVADDGTRAFDLDEVRRRRSEFAAGGRLRTHFHVPLDWDRPGALGSTRAEVERVLSALQPPFPLLEVETYTWSVLDAARFGGEDLAAALRAELAFARRGLGARGEPG